MEAHKAQLYSSPAKFQSARRLTGNCGTASDVTCACFRVPYKLQYQAMGKPQLAGIHTHSRKQQTDESVMQSVDNVVQFNGAESIGLKLQVVEPNMCRNQCH